MNRLRKPAAKFTMVPNGLIRDARLTLRAKGVYCILFSKPDGWVYIEDALVAESKDGRDAFRAAVKELIAGGWLEKRQVHDAGGRFSHTDWVLTVDWKAVDGGTVAGESTPIKTDRIKTEKSPPNPQGGERDVSHSDWFKAVCEAYRKASPSRADEDAAWRIWKAKVCEPDAAAIVRGVTELAKTDRWRAEDGRWVPNLSKFLREAQWKGIAAEEGPTEAERRAAAAARRKAFDDAIKADRKARGLYVSSTK